MTTEVYNRDMSSPRRYYFGMQQGIMQNKPNFLKYPMNTSPVMTKHYEQKSPLRQSENKAKTNPISEKQK